MLPPNPVEHTDEAELLQVRNSIQACLDRLLSASMREQDQGEWFASHPLPFAKDTETFKASVRELRRQLEEARCEIPGSAEELAIWLRDSNNQTAFIKWLDLAVLLTEKLSLGCSAAIKKVSGFEIMEFQGWPLDANVGILRNVFDLVEKNFDVAALTRENLESDPALSPSDRLMDRYVPALTSPHEEIRYAARTTYEEYYSRAAIQNWPDLNGQNTVRKLVLQHGSAKKALEAFISQDASQSTNLKALGLEFFPATIDQLKVVFRDLQLLSRYTCSPEFKLDLTILFLMAYIEEHCLNGASSVANAQAEMSAALGVITNEG